ncbi:MAG: DNA-binding protein [Promethearchaeota archaeon]
MGSDPEIEAIRRKKMIKFQKRIDQAQKREEKRVVAETQREKILQDILTDEAYSTLDKLRSSNRQEVLILENQCLQLAINGYLRSKITKNLLEELHLQLRREKHEPKFIRKSRKGKKKLFTQ